MGGKTYALLLEPLRHLNNPHFKALIFRRNSTQIRSPGGLWDTSLQLYSKYAESTKTTLEWKFHQGATLKFAHLEHEDTVYSYQGSQIPLVCFDEVVHFTERQFVYMISRLRSMSGVPGYMRATCNPDPDTWVKKWIGWFIGEDGFPIKERCGKLRWFIRQNDEMIWANSTQELLDQYGKDEMPKSITFIPSTVYDNQILLKKDPAYISNLKALSRVDRMRLLEGNWNVKESAGNFFRREWFPLVDAIPSGWTKAIRFWDRAATKPSESHSDPDWTRGIKLYRYPNQSYVIGDLKSIRETPGKVEKFIYSVAQHDGPSVQIMAQQDPGSAGVLEAEYFTRMLSGYVVKTAPFSKDKITRAKPVSAQAEAGNIQILRAIWNEELFNELENFPEGSHDDIVDSLSGAFNSICQSISSVDAFWNAR